LYAGTLNQTYSVYSRLIFLSIGLALSYKEKNDLHSDFQRSFLELSEKFASEFIPDILQIGQDWRIGEAIDTEKSRLHNKLISNPNKYDPKKDPIKSHWQIFPKKHDIEQYLRQLPGAEEYYIAVKIEDEDSTLFRENMVAAAKKGNGQAIYALSQYGLISANRFHAAENGSPDAFEDLIDSISEISTDVEFINSSKLSYTDKRALAQIDSLIYLYTLMERLGISHWAHGCINTTRLSIESDSGYESDFAYSTEIKYELCDHDHVAYINSRAYKWSLGKRFDDQFFEQLKILGLSW
jgi:hypothetical protein